MEEHALRVSKLRLSVRQQAYLELRKLNIVVGGVEERMTKLGKRIAKGHHRTPKRLQASAGERLIEEVPPGLRQKRQRAKPLLPMEKMMIAYEVLVKHQHMSDVALDYRTSTRVVSKITTKAKTSISEITDAIDAQHRKWAKEQEIMSIVDSFLKANLAINKAEDVKIIYDVHHEEDVTLNQVKYVMKTIMGMRYTKIIRQNIHANTDRCIYQRQ